MKRILTTSLIVALALVTIVVWARTERGDWNYTGEHDVDNLSIGDVPITASGAEINALDMSGVEDGMPQPWDIENGAAYFDTFMAWAVDDTTTNPLAWIYKSDADGLAELMVGTTGGIMHLEGNIGDNHETYLQLGSANIDTSFTIVTNTGNKFWMKTRAQAIDTNYSVAYFIGMAQSGACVDNFLADNTGDIADDDIFGFLSMSETNEWWDAVYRFEGSNVFRSYHVADNNEDWHEFMLYFDGLKYMYYYVDDIAVWTVKVDTAPIAFPDAVGIMPIYAVKAGETNIIDSIGLNVDWLKVAQQM